MCYGRNAVGCTATRLVQGYGSSAGMHMRSLRGEQPAHKSLRA
jgi:hypothetical protein